MIYTFLFILFKLNAQQNTTYQAVWAPKPPPMGQFTGVLAGYYTTSHQTSHLASIALVERKNAQLKLLKNANV